MACNSPLYAYGHRKDDGKLLLKFAKSHFLEFLDCGNLIYDEKVLVPCGQCIGCRLDYSRQWATRCVLESIFHEFNYFVTLTYADEHISHCYCLPSVDLATGEAFPSSRPSLVYRDIVLFNKRLRAFFDRELNVQGIRFYGAGEYGPLNMRPHFHVIYFNFPLPDLYPWSKNFNGDILYRSDILESLWPFGFVTVGLVNWNTCAYVARYMTKKHKGLDSDYYVEAGVHPEKSVMSRMPGIGYEYFSKNKEIFYKFDEIVLPGDTVRTVRPPKYFDRLYDIENHERLLDITKSRKIQSEFAQAQALFGTDLSEKKYFELKELLLKERASKLLRTI